MAKYWANIDSSYITSGDGTSSAAFDYWQLYSFIKGVEVSGSSIASGDVVAIQGQRQEIIFDPGLFGGIISGSYIVSGWGGVDDQYNWSMWPTDNIQWGFGDYNNPNALDLSDLFIKDLEFSVVNVLTFNNCTFFDSLIAEMEVSANPAFPQSVGSFNGCTFTQCDISLFAYWDGLPQSQYDFNNCVFDSSFVGDFEAAQVSAANFNKCVFNTTSAYSLSSIATSALSITDCEFSFDFSATFPPVVDVSGSITSADILFGDYGINSDTYTERQAYPNDKGVYGTTRRGPGAFYFDSIYYVDLSATTSGGGSSNVPLGMPYFQTFINNDQYNTGDLYKIKGTYDSSAAINFYGYETSIGPVTFGAWNLLNYGPWRLHSDSYITFAGDSDVVLYNMENCILSAPKIDLGTGYSAPVFNHNPEYFSCYLSASDYITIDIRENLGFSGCTLIAPLISVDTWDSDFSATYKDCVLDVSIMSAVAGTPANPVTIIDNTVLIVSGVNVLSGTNMGTFEGTNLQTDWSPPTWPAWDAVQASYKFSDIGSGITLDGSGEW